jgi:hypothetical protein
MGCKIYAVAKVYEADFAGCAPYLIVDVDPYELNLEEGLLNLLNRNLMTNWQ